MPKTIQSNEAARYKVTIAGTTFTQADPKGMDTLIVEDHVDMIGVAQVILNLENEAWGSLKMGDEVEIEFGGSTKKIFKGHITSLRHAFQKGKETVAITAMDPLCKLAAASRTQTFEKVKDSDIVSKVLGQAGVTAGTVDATEKQHDYVIQRNESDLDFLKRLAARNNHLLLANEGKVDFTKQQFNGASISVPGDHIQSLDYQFGTGKVPTTLTVYGWNPIEKKMVSGTASSGDIESIGGGQNAIAGSGQIWQEEKYISDVQIATQEDAKKVAVAELNRIARNFIKGRAVIEGNGKVCAGAKVKFEGLRKGYNPEVYVVSSRHVYETRRGYTTEVSFCGNTFPE